jgi:tetratricopeptide (TPR) repeat protein
MTAVSLYVRLGRLSEARALAREALSYDPALAAKHSLFWLAWNNDQLGLTRNTLAPHLEHVDTPHRRELVELALAGDFAQLADRDEAAFWKADNHRRAAEQLAKQDRVDEAREYAESALAFYRSVRATRFARESLLEDLRTARA